MPDDIVIPNAGQSIAGANTVDPSWYRAFKGLATFANTLQRSLGDASTGLDTRAAKGPQKEGFSVTYDFPADGTRYIELGAGYAWTIKKMRTRTSAGTATAALKNNGSSIASSNATTTQDEQTLDQAIAATDTISITLSSTSSDCEGLCVTVEGERTLA